MIDDQQRRPAPSAREKRSWVTAFRNRPEAAMEDPTAKADDRAAPAARKSKSVAHFYGIAPRSIYAFATALTMTEKPRSVRFLGYSP
jgi:hypothetical protein